MFWRQWSNMFCQKKFYPVFFSSFSSLIFCFIFCLILIFLVTASNLEKYAGKPIFSQDTIYDNKDASLPPGIVMGLAWNPLGGFVRPILYSMLYFQWLSDVNVSVILSMITKDYSLLLFLTSSSSHFFFFSLLLFLQEAHPYSLKLSLLPSQSLIMVTTSYLVSS